MVSLKTLNIPLSEKAYTKLVQDVLITKRGKVFDNTPVRHSYYEIYQLMNAHPNPQRVTLQQIKDTIFWLRKYEMLDEDEFTPTNQGTIEELKKQYKKWESEQKR